MPKTILITGATSGFGLACAERFADEGWQLIVCGRRKKRLEQFIKKHPNTAIHAAQLDVRDLTAVKKMIEKLPATFSDINVLINNAGLARGLERAYEVNIEDWESMIDTNIKGLCYLTRCVLPNMVEKNNGHIVNLGSIAGNYPYPGGNVYGATKSFVKQFSRNLLTDLVHTKVRVTNIEPGLAESEFSVVRFNGNKEQADAIYEGTSPITPKDIAETIYWAVNMPAHVNINTIELMATCQSCGPLTIHRTTE